jgi:hypothetical protein
MPEEGGRLGVLGGELLQLPRDGEMSGGVDGDRSLSADRCGLSPAVENLPVTADIRVRTIPNSTGAVVVLDTGRGGASTTLRVGTDPVRLLA